MISLIKLFLDKVFFYYLRKNSKDLEFELQLRARISTGDFIEKKMKNVPTFPNKFSLLDFALKQSNNDGIFLEFGVYKGETINFIANRIGNKIVYGFDSFEGLPEDWRPGFGKGFFKTKIPSVRNNVTLIKGWFDKTLPEFIKENKKEYSFIHIDSDLYSSAQVIFKYLDKKINKNMIIVFDEFFNYYGWENGEYKAFYEYVSKRRLKFKFLGYCDKNEQVAIKII